MELIKLKPQEDLPPGPTFQCPDCGTRIRPGQPHAATLPYAHQSYEALISRVYADQTFEDLTR